MRLRSVRLRSVRLRFVRLCFVRALVLAGCLLLIAGAAHAQLVSPGKLSAAHAGLEGVGNCTQCHDFGQHSFRANCLSCHAEIRARIDRGSGYHAFTKKLECATCHKEHHGRDFKLIRWDPSRFEHKQAGFELDGAHAGKSCRDCHTPKNIVQTQIRKKSADAQQRTYLGLDPACGSCHRDEHRGQLGRDCASCHATSDWKKNSFSHARARFQLTGRHASVDCARCHPRQSGAGAQTGAGAQGGMGAQGDTDGWMRFRGIPFKGCIDCHEDTHHKGAFGRDCENCHAPAGWKQVRIAKGSFDHSKTHFPLTGRHALVTCNDCHTGGNVRKFEGRDLAACRTCHADAHAAQFAARADAGECSACHTVEGFTPARFEPAQHEATRFPLTGAHGAIACRRCHVDTNIRGVKTRRFHWDDLACTQCHEDPHADQFAGVVTTKGCGGCHNTTSWHAMQFDHARTNFPLEGKHTGLACARCHVEGDVRGVRTVVYRIDAAACNRCHVDIHQGQLRDAAGATHCDRCHTTADWKPTRFQHATMSRFELTGRHALASCDACHKTETIDGAPAPVRRFRPLDTRCASCHKDFKE